MEYRRYTPADRQAVVHLLTEEMTPAMAAARSATFDWQYTQNPHSDGRSPFMLAIRNAEIIGVRGVMPARLIYQGVPRMAVWNCDVHVAVRFRGQGIVVELKNRMQDDADVMMAYGSTDTMRRVLDRSGWQASRAVAGYSFHVSEPGMKGALKNLQTKLYRHGQWPARKTSTEVTVYADSDFEPDVDELWARSAPTHFSAVERDAAYLNWKYRRHPLLRYRWYGARADGRLSGLLVARPDADTSVIVDYCGPLGADEVMADLVDAAVQDLSKRGTRRIHCETTDPGMASALRRTGFRKSRGDYSFRLRCNYLDDPDPVRNFFLMTGDSDNDFSVLPPTVPSA